jgi:hypothetical protein
MEIIQHPFDFIPNLEQKESYEGGGEKENEKQYGKPGIEFGMDFESREELLHGGNLHVGRVDVHCAGILLSAGDRSTLMTYSL